MTSGNRAESSKYIAARGVWGVGVALVPCTYKRKSLVWNSFGNVVIRGHGRWGLSGIQICLWGGGRGCPFAE